jgi:hypothetical protein
MEQKPQNSNEKRDEQQRSGQQAQRPNEHSGQHSQPHPDRADDRGQHGHKDAKGPGRDKEENKRQSQNPGNAGSTHKQDKH